MLYAFYFHKKDSKQGHGYAIREEEKSVTHSQFAINHRLEGCIDASTSNGRCPMRSEERREEGGGRREEEGNEEREREKEIIKT